jgi:hypothetical protein
MKSAIQVLFLLLYTVSSYNTAQNQVVDIIYEVLHATTGNADAVLHDAGKAQVQYTHFREARKAGTDYLSSVSVTPGFFQLASFRVFLPQSISLASQLRVETSAPRAPPRSF